MKHRVFVYGSLKRDFHNHRVILNDNTKFVGVTHTSSPVFEMISLSGFPGVLKNGNAAIMGELYLVDDEVFAQLDRLEGNGHFYNRELVHLEDHDEPAWMYILMSNYTREKNKFNVDVHDAGDIIIHNWGDLRKIQPDDWLDYRSRTA